MNENTTVFEKTLEERISEMNVKKKDDGTYIVSNNGTPFQVTPDYPCGEITLEKINEYIANGGRYEDYIEIVPEIPLDVKISLLEQESLKYTSYILAGIDVDVNQQKLLNIMLDIERLKNNLE